MIQPDSVNINRSYQRWSIEKKRVRNAQRPSGTSPSSRKIPVVAINSPTTFSLPPNYPAPPPKYIFSVAPAPILNPHTYLVEAIVIMKTVSHASSPALHSAEARDIELPSGTSLAQFLLAFHLS